MTRDAGDRLADPKKIKQHPWFAGIDWEKLEKKELKPPYVPPVKDASDVGMIDDEFKTLSVNEAMNDQKKVRHKPTSITLLMWLALSWT